MEEELADFLPKKKEIKRLDFSGIGNEWYAMALYNKQLYEEKVLEEKKKENELRQKIREELNAQIKSKIKKEQEEKLREEQEEKAFKYYYRFDKYRKDIRANKEQKKSFNKD